MTDLLAFCTDLPVQDLAAGEVLVAEGSPPSAMWVLQSGTLVVERDGMPFARIDTPGAVFGEMSVVLGRPVVRPCGQAPWSKFGSSKTRRRSSSAALRQP